MTHNIADREGAVVYSSRDEGAENTVGTSAGAKKN